MRYTPRPRVVPQSVRRDVSLGMAFRTRSSGLWTGPRSDLKTSRLRSGRRRVCSVVTMTFECVIQARGQCGPHLWFTDYTSMWLRAGSETRHGDTFRARDDPRAERLHSTLRRCLGSIPASPVLPHTSSKGDFREVRGCTSTTSPFNRPISAHSQGVPSLRASVAILVRRLESRSRQPRAAPTGSDRRNISSTC